jgi:DNA-directed RNA polymerase specialized sigma24 family protein
MSFSSKGSPPWWDRERDQQGRPLREDVRKAARNVWPYLSYLGKQALSDFESDGPPLMEKIIEEVSAYLDAKGIPEHDPSGLVVVSFRHEMYRMAEKQSKTVTLDAGMDLSDWLQSSHPASEMDQRIFVEELVRRLRPRNQAILRLRIAGYEWKEIAGLLGISPSTVRNDFWRDVKHAYTELLGPQEEPE